MSDLDLVMQWHDNINQVEKTEAIVGGASGNANQAVKQLAENTLWLRDLINKLEPIKVNDIYTTIINHENAAAVAAHHGYGTWERFAEGRTLVGFSTNADDPSDYKTMDNEFGENEHTLTVKEMPSHVHQMRLQANGQATLSYPIDIDSQVMGEYSNDNLQGQSAMQSEGDDKPHNNIQPSRVVGHWLRTA